MVKMDNLKKIIIVGLCSLAVLVPTVCGEKTAAEENIETTPATVAAKPTGDTIDLTVLGKLLESGQAETVAARLSENIDRFSHKDLPAVLLMLGKAQLQAGRGDRKMLLQAGLNLMWVFAEFPRSKQAPEALFYAAEVNRQLGQSVAAALALREIIRQYTAARYGSWSQKAKAELNK